MREPEEPRDVIAFSVGSVSRLGIMMGLGVFIDAAAGGFLSARSPGICLLWIPFVFASSLFSFDSSFTVLINSFSHQTVLIVTGCGVLRCVCGLHVLPSSTDCSKPRGKMMKPDLRLENNGVLCNGFVPLAIC